MKNIGLLTLLITATLLLALAIPVGAAGPKAAAAPVAAAAAPVPAAAAAPEKHPNIEAALEAMRNAKHHLDDAAHDYHGHRVKAIEHLDQAIHEAEICMQEP